MRIVIILIGLLNIISVRGDLEIDTSNTGSNKSWVAVVLEVGIPHSNGNDYDLIWEFKNDKYYYHDKITNVHFHFQSWRTQNWWKKTTDSGYSEDPPDYFYNHLQWGGYSTHNSWNSTDTYYSNGYRTPSGIPDSWVQAVLNNIKLDFTALWDGPNGWEDRTAVGNWFSTTGGVSYSADASYVAQAEIINWDHRNPNLPDQVTFIYQGSEFDYLWLEEDCFDGSYHHQSVISPTCDGIYIVPGNLIDAGSQCPARKEIGPRDHSIYVLEGSQTLVGGP